MLFKLVQNAGVCQFGEGVQPAVCEGLLVATNERGCGPDNIKAIWKPGSSSERRTSPGVFTVKKGE